MSYVKVFIKFDKPNLPLLRYLDNIGTLVSEKDTANVILTDSVENVEQGFVNFVLTDIIGEGYINISPLAGGQEVYQNIVTTFSAIDRYTSPVSGNTGVVGSSEENIVAGFSRHFSHNILNPLLMVHGFMRVIKSHSPPNGQIASMWKTVEQKLGLIEETVNGYNDYYQALELRLRDSINISRYLSECLQSLSDKSFDKPFSAYLGNYKDSFNITYTPSHLPDRFTQGNALFLKLALCYIFKDTIRYAESFFEVVQFNVSSKFRNDQIIIDIFVLNLNIPENVINSMFRPWDHSIFLQSFDHWGMIIAKMIITKHDGSFTITNDNDNLKYTITI